MKKYSFDEHPEHKVQLEMWAKKWIANAMSTKPMDDADRAAMRLAVKGLYEAAGLVPPPEHRIVFVPSPFVLRFAGGFAAAIWHMRKSGKKDADAATAAATRAATYAATADATRDATNVATYAATADATRDATNVATYAATADATYAATADATNVATADKWYRINAGMCALANALGVGKFGLECARKAYSMWQGGNQWSGWVSFISFFRHVAKLPLDYSKYDHWENAAIHGGPRIMHPEFCMISDRPTKLLVDEQSRPHCDTGPFCEWSDGTALYSIHGVRVPAWIAETPAERLDVKKILELENVEHRLMALRKIGPERMLAELSGISVSKKGDEYELFEVTIEGGKEKLLKMKNPSEDKIHYEFVEPHIKTVNEALAWRRGLSLKQFTEPVFKT